jgi:glycerol-3-phosphate acyltransferase PlsY
MDVLNVAPDVAPDVAPWVWLGVVVATYLLGAVPFGLLVTRSRGVGDIRQQGSGNIGATNVLRTAGRHAAALTLALDMLKGALPVLAATMIWGPVHPITAAVAWMAVIGHMFPVYLGFRGGKGVATGLGVFLAWTPWAGLAAVAVWLATVKLTRISSLGALGAFMTLPLWVYALSADAMTIRMTAVLMSLLVIWRHRDNIRRLLDGSEGGMTKDRPKDRNTRGDGA